MYVVSVVGEWVVRGDSERALRPLDRIPISARIGVRPGAPVDTSTMLVLRDPRSLQTATLTCRPAARCSAYRNVSQLTFRESGVRPSPRASTLFVQLGGGAEQRARVKLVGARGAGLDWGLIVLTVDSGRLRIEPLLSRIDADEADLVARICPFVGAGGSARDCTDARELRRDDCTLRSSARCPFALQGDSLVPLSIDVFTRTGSTLSPSPVAHAYAVVAATSRRQRAESLIGAYRTDLAALRAKVSEEEFDALEAAAVWQAARSRR